MEKVTMLNELSAHGYRIELHTNDTGSTTVRFHARNGLAKVLAHTYSDEWTHEEIRLDCALSLLHWAGMQVVEKLDYV